MPYRHRSPMVTCIPCNLICRTIQIREYGLAGETRAVWQPRIRRYRVMAPHSGLLGLGTICKFQQRQLQCLLALVPASRQKGACEKTGNLASVIAAALRGGQQFAASHRNLSTGFSPLEPLHWNTHCCCSEHALRRCCYQFIARTAKVLSGRSMQDCRQLQQ